MSAQLRLRLSPSPKNGPGRCRPRDDGGGAGVDPGEEGRVPTQSPGGPEDTLRSSPSKDLRDTIRAPWKLSPRVSVRHSFLLLLGLFSIMSVRILHNLAMTSGGTTRAGHQWNGPPHNLRPPPPRGAGARSSYRNNRPRVVDASDLAASTRPTWWGALVDLLPILRMRQHVDDPMLHREGWVPAPSEWEWAWSGERVEQSEEEEEEEAPRCVPMAPWQTTSYPNCNRIHEIDLKLSTGPGSHVFPRKSPEDGRRRLSYHPPALRQLYEELMEEYPGRKAKKKAKLVARGVAAEEWVEFLGQGWFRSAWEVDAEGVPEWDEDKERLGIEESVVLKTLRIERDFLEEYYELHRRDALAMERLTFSPYVLEIYGYCGQSAINELANFGIAEMTSLEKVARSFRGMDDIEPVSKIRLQLAEMIATGVSHLHSIDYPDHPDEYSYDEDSDSGSVDRGRVRSNATLVHYDLNPRNIAIIKKGKPKLNDFNVAEFLTWDTKNHRTCGFQGRFREPWWRAPEEMHYHLSNYTNPEYLTEKVDIFAMGGVFWDLLTSHSPRGKMQKEFAERTRVKVARGAKPKCSASDCNQTRWETDPALMALKKVTWKCLRTRPEDRPTAGEIAAEISEALENLPEGFGDKKKWREKMRKREEEKRKKEEEKKAKKKLKGKDKGKEKEDDDRSDSD